MIEKYKQWIKENVKDPQGRCEETTIEMKKAFPELIRVRGFYYCTLEGKREHWWLKTEHDDIIDPTRAQFMSAGYGDYKEWSEEQAEPTDKCLNCGGYCYDGRQCCCDSCYKEFVQSLNKKHNFDIIKVDKQLKLKAIF
jgi:hypothetical protein